MINVLNKLQRGVKLSSGNLTGNLTHITNRNILFKFNLAKNMFLTMYQ